jgi:hypothetical protein
MSDAYSRVEGLRQACHDIRQPVAGVLALAGAALAQTELPQSVRRYLHEIVRLAEWQSDVIEHWLQVPAGGSDSPATDVVRAGNDAVADERLT